MATSTLRSSQTFSQTEPAPERDIILHLRKKPRVQWQGDVVDNEFMNKKKSKKCCIYHKKKAFDESDSESSGSDSGSEGEHDHKHCDHDHDDRDSHEHDHAHSNEIPE